MNLWRSSDRLVTTAKPKLPNLHMLIKLESLTSQKLGPQDFWQIANSFLNKGKPLIPPLSNDLKVLSSAFDKAQLFSKNISRNSNLDGSGNSLPVF